MQCLLLFTLINNVIVLRYLSSAESKKNAKYTIDKYTTVY